MPVGVNQRHAYCACDCGQCCCRGYEPTVTVTGAVACPDANGTYNFVEFYCDGSENEPVCDYGEYVGNVCRFQLDKGSCDPGILLMYYPPGWAVPSNPVPYWQFLLVMEDGGVPTLAYHETGPPMGCDEYGLHGTFTALGTGLCSAETITVTVS